jgi:hypothetical protein
LAFQDDRRGERRRKSEDESDSDGPGGGSQKKKRPPAGEVGQALRSAYERTLDEAIPPEMLDLLGKLG